ncbi:unnamed protein product (macronuclear) [Paramecium tetraurelia]|uniref:TRAF-type domain-containing protein n=1 Tax=Paramecium tetraurelia TaxID=5888 RepID=A0C4J4_PARTE|nr:uncharacterized protein GSPATT00035191001 [Paramecium tetraurelia]CAK65711.1 unnamed protein product [Paramecium tetraurelia]|eukprot:XP_001433108.1 hypothetical protein (macronuclear) [Paramecium tetraurelia strain d4-2]
MNSLSISQSPILRSLIVDPKSINLHLICVICQELVVDPKECSGCKILFCSICIFKQLEKNQSCQNCCQNIRLNDSHPIVRNLISEIQIKCINEGCSQQMQLSRLDSHLKQCEYEKTNCPHSGCNFKDCLQQMKVHQQICGYITKTCQKCKLIHKMNEEHDCLDIVIKKIKLMEKQIQQQNKIIRKLAKRLDQNEKKKNQQINDLCQHEFEQNQVMVKCDKCHLKNTQSICKKCGVCQCLECQLYEII